jgi:hypothetical protein
MFVPWEALRVEWDDGDESIALANPWEIESA